MAEVNWARFAHPIYVSSVMTDPWEIPNPKTFLAMFETLDGCIKFQELDKMEPTIVFGVSHQVSVATKDDPFDQMRPAVTKRRYQLFNASGPGGKILHYREMGE